MVTMTDPLLGAMFHAVDALDTAAVMKLFTDDPTLRFANAEPAVGWDQVEATVAGFFAGFAGLRHDITGVWTGTWAGGEVKCVESDVTYTRHDGTRLGPLPAVTTLRLTGGRVQHYQVFMDPSPLFG